MLGHAARAGDPVVAAVRPEKIHVQETSASDLASPASIVESIYLGDWVKYRIELASGETLLVKVPGGGEDDVHAAGTRVLLAIAPRDVMIYPE